MSSPAERRWRFLGPAVLILPLVFSLVPRPGWTASSDADPRPGDATVRLLEKLQSVFSAKPGVWLETCRDAEDTTPLMAAGAEVDARNEAGETPLALAVRAGEQTGKGPLVGRVRDTESTVEHLPAAGADGDGADAAGRTLLVQAIAAGQVPFAKRLLEQGAAVDARDRRGWTALMYAAAGEPSRTIGKAIVESLLARVADVRARGERGENAVDLCRDSEVKDLLALEVLKQRQADRTGPGQTQEHQNAAQIAGEIRHHEQRLGYLALLERNHRGWGRDTSPRELFPRAEADLYHDTELQGRSSLRRISYGGHVIELNLGVQVLGLDLPEHIEYSDTNGTAEAEIYPTIDRLAQHTDFASAAIFVAKAKGFDDGLLAAVELLCQRGAGPFPGKAELLRLLSERLRSLAPPAAGVDPAPRALVRAAAALGGIEIDGDPAVAKEAERIRNEFLADTLRSKPIGFYTWTPELTRIFQQDRLLQTDLLPDRGASPPADYPTLLEQAKKRIRIFTAGLQEERLAAGYRAQLAFMQRLTNPFSPEHRTLLPDGEIEPRFRYSLFPPSRSPEAQSAKAGFDLEEKSALIDTLIERIRSGELSLSPRTDSGWYDYQLWALEPFVVPERMPGAPRLRLGEKYRTELLELFKSAIALTRETHIKQLEVPRPGAAVEKPTLRVYPLVTVEPVPDYYLRRAQAYRFVRELLTTTFGGDALHGTVRLTPAGPASRPLDEELTEIETLFRGAYRLSCEETGIAAEAPAGNADKDSALRWVNSFGRDPDIGGDQRMMVPVFHNAMTGKTKVWVFLGYEAKPLRIWFAEPPGTRVTDTAGNPADDLNLDFREIWRPLIAPVSAEVSVTQLLDRDEFRTLCDRHKTRSEILKTLQAQ